MKRNSLQRKAVGLLLAGAIMICVQPNLAYAEDNLACAEEMQMQTKSVSPMYVQSNRCQMRLDFSGRTAKCQALIRGKRGTTKISGLLKLYDNTAGRQVASWAVSESSSYYSGTKTATVKKGTAISCLFPARCMGRMTKLARPYRHQPVVRVKGINK